MNAKQILETLGNDKVSEVFSTAFIDKLVNDLLQDNIDMKMILEPFAHEDLSDGLGVDYEGDLTKIYGRNKAILTLGDFRRARKLYYEM